MLTAQQAKLLRFIEETQKLHGVTPSYNEMCAHLDLRSKTGIIRLLDALMERGFIHRHRGLKRAIEILKPQTHLNPEYQRGYRDGYAAGQAQTEEDRARSIGVNQR